MYKRYKISLILPCRNEGNHLKKTIARIPKFVDEIIVVSNRSTDNTVAEAKRLGAKAFEDNRHIKGIGYGYAIMTGLKNATGDLVMKVDGDATYPVEDLDKVIDYFIENKLDFVSCARYPIKAGTKIPAKLRFGVWVLNTEVRLLYGFKVNDILSGMWLTRRSNLKKLNLSMGDWNLSPQVKVNAATHPDIKFGEFNIAQHQREGESHQSHFKTGFSHLTWIAKNRLKSSTKKPAARKNSK